jgi:putative transcriptional regulator
METRKKKLSRATEAILETAADMHRIGLMDDTDYNKITMRHLGKNAVINIVPLAGDEIRSMRERARMSQAVFARHLNVTTGYVSQLERGAKHPTGAALALLNIIRRKGIEAIL